MPHSKAHPPANRGWTAAILVCAAIVAYSIWGIVSSHTALSQAFDEPAHLACGMEWLDHGTYVYETQHPPLSRIAGAFFPYWNGMHTQNAPDMWKEGNAILHSTGDYSAALALARRGMLVFFLLLVAVVALWAKLLYSREAAVAAVIALCGIPSVLAHAGFVATDLPFAATFCGSLLAFSWWLRRRDRIAAVTAGVSAGLALVTKFSFLVFYPICIAVLLGLEALDRRRTARPFRIEWRPVTRQAAIALLAGFLVVWAVYRFELRPLRDPSERPYSRVDALAGSEGLLHDVAYGVLEWPYYPLLSLGDGLGALADHVFRGHRQALFGELRFHGVWYYFPVMLGVRTPLPLMALVAAGAIFLIHSTSLPFARFEPLLCAATILLAALPSTLNLGVRYVLPIYPLLALVAGFAAAQLFRGGVAKRALAVALLGMPLVVCAATRPDYLSYLNVLGSNRADMFLGAGDFGGNQSLYALRDELKRLRVDRITIGYHGSADISRHDLPPFELLERYRPVAGWVVASRKLLLDDLTSSPPYAGYRWLAAYEPVSRAGGFLIYHIPSGDLTGRVAAPR